MLARLFASCVLNIRKTNQGLGYFFDDYHSLQLIHLCIGCSFFMLFYLFSCHKIEKTCLPLQHTINQTTYYEETILTATAYGSTICASR